VVLEAKYCERRWIKNEDSLLEREGNDMVAPKRLQKNWTEAIIILLIWISLATSILFKWVI
jgi:hypothetical protein